MMAMGENQSRVKAAAIGVSAPPRAVGSGQQAVQLLLGVLRGQSWFIVLALSYMLLGYVLSRLYDHPFSLLLYSRFHVAVYLALIVTFLVARTARIIFKHRPERPLTFVWNDLMGRYRVPKRILYGLPALLLLPLAHSAHTSLKLLIPVISPFAWDEALAKFDTAVHGGTAPWELLQPVIGTPWITHWIDYLYGPPWFWMMIFMQFWFTFTLDSQRHRFLVTYFLCWLLLGSVLATLLSSGGPVYYGQFIEGPDPFVPLFSYLDSVADSHRMLARLSQDYLWQAHIERNLSLGVGISAMPGMHISVGFLFVLVTWRLHWLFRVVSVSYLIILQIGSVHLGWHYAIDGYASIVGTYAIWWAVGRALEWRERRLADLPAQSEPVDEDSLAR
ncbi:MAG: phosphatase PAP2 family protein [Kiloniellales bacterium]